MVDSNKMQKPIRFLPILNDLEAEMGSVWQSNMAMESGPLLDDVPKKKDGGFPRFSIDMGKL
jgi:hypothetical protein